MSITTILLAIVMWFLMLTPATVVQEPDTTEVTPAATAADNPLIDMLALIPDTPELAEAPPGFVDYEALRSVYPETAVFSSWAEWKTATQEDRDAARTWMEQMLRVFTGPNEFLPYLNLGEETRSLIGFEFFDVDRALVAGNPPSKLTIYQGDLQPELITAAYEARDYHATDSGDVTLLSTGNDGMKQDLINRDPANPFGGDLGRNEPLALLGTTVIGTPNDALLNTAIETVNGQHPSLLDNAPFVAIAEALYSRAATPLQVQYLNVDVASEFAPSEGAGPLPGYMGAAISDMQLGSTQIAVVALAYETEAEARAASQELNSRLASMTVSGNSSRPLLDEVEDAEIHEPQVYYSESTGMYVAVGMISYSSPITDEGSYARDGYIATHWNRAYVFGELSLVAATE